MNPFCGGVPSHYALFVPQGPRVDGPSALVCRRTIAMQGWARARSRGPGQIADPTKASTPPIAAATATPAPALRSLNVLVTGITLRDRACLSSASGPALRCLGR